MDARKWIEEGKEIEGRYVRKKHSKQNGIVNGVEGYMIHTNTWGWKPANQFVVVWRDLK